MAAKNSSGTAGGARDDKRVTADIVIVGGGPATLGLLTNAVKSNRLNELVAKGDGLAIIEQGLNFGGGSLQNFGINSNTSANGFIKCLYKRREIANLAVAQSVISGVNQGAKPNNNESRMQQTGSPNPRRYLKAGSGVPAAQAVGSENPAASPVRTKLKDMTNQGLDEGDSDEDAMDEEDVYQPKKYEYVALNPFKDLYKHSPLIQMSFEFGPSIIPLSTVGMILNYTGNHLLHFIHSVLGRRIFYPAHKVVSVQLMNNGDILTTAVRKEYSIILNEPHTAEQSAAAKESQAEEVEEGEDRSSALAAPPAQNHEGPFRIINHGETQVTFRSKAIVLSNGGSQGLHPEFYNWFPFMKDRRQDLLTSDYVLQKKGFYDVIKRIKEFNKKKIVIIGGSHSGFSTAWLLLNGPADILHNTHVVPSAQRIHKNTGKFDFPGAPIRGIQNCARCCGCNFLPKKQRKTNTCKCQCRCYGFFRYADWGFDFSQLPQFREADIKILYRDRIRVFYSRVQQAQAEGYSDYKQLSFQNKNGFLYSFTGLRGDAKRMYKAIQKGDEKRVKLIKAPTPQDQAKHLETADLVIWACGYQTNQIPVKDIDSKLIQMSAKVPFTQFDVDQRCRIITSDNGLLMKTFGSGLAYPVRTNDGMTMPEAGKANPRADSFSLYMNYVANTLLSNLLPKTRLINKNHRTVRLGGKKTIAAQALQQERTNQANASGAGTRAGAAASSSNAWVRSGSEQTPVPRSNTLSRPIVKPNPSSNNQPAAAQQVNISKVQSSPIKTPAKVVPSKVSSSLTAKPMASSLTQAPASSTTAATTTHQQESSVVGNYQDALIENYQNTPGYLQTNYITEQRKVAKGETTSPQPKKRTNWVPSSKMAPTTNKIPKETLKVIEMRHQAEIIKQHIDGQPFNQTLTTTDIPTVMIQMQLSENGKAFQAISQSFNLLKQPMNQVVAAGGRYTLKTHELATNVKAAAVAANETLIYSQPTATHPEFIKSGCNYNAQQSYGLVNAPDGAACGSIDRGHLYQTPQKSATFKGGEAASPLIFNKQSTVIDNTPQIQKRKASFKMVKSANQKQEGAEVASLTTSVLGDKTYQKQQSHFTKRDSTAPPCQSLVKSIESNGSANGAVAQIQAQVSGQNNVAQQNNQSSFKQSMQLGSMNYHVVTSGEPVIKPASQSGVKRHPQTANQSGNQQSSSGKKKQSQSRHTEKGRATYNYIAQQLTNTTNISSSPQKSGVLQNQKSTQHIGSKSKRAGTFLKNCKTKFSGSGTDDLGGQKTAAESNNGLPGGAISPEKSLSHLASAGQRQIFSDDSGSRQSARIQHRHMNERASELNLGATGFKNLKVNIDRHHDTLDKSFAQNYDSNMIMSQTPKNINQFDQSPSIQKVQSSHSIKRRTTTDQTHLVVPLNGNFMRSEAAGVDLLDNSPDSIKLRLKPDPSSDYDRNLNDRDLQNLNVSLPGHQKQRSQQVKITSKAPDGTLAEPAANSATNSKARDLGSVANRTNNAFMPAASNQQQAQNVVEIGSKHVSSVQEVQSPTQHIGQSNNNFGGQRASCRQKSASRTHRSQSRGKHQQMNQDGSQTKMFPLNSQKNEDPSAYGPLSSAQYHHIHKGQVVTTVGSLAQQQQRSVESQLAAANSYGSTKLNFAAQTGNKIYHNTTATPSFPQAQQLGGSGMIKLEPQIQGAQNTRHSIGGIDNRMVNLIGQSSQQVVPLKIFQLSVAKPENKNEAIVQRHFMQQVGQLQAMQQYSQLHQQQQLNAAQLSASPQPTSKKHHNLSMHQSVTSKPVSLVHQHGGNVAMARNMMVPQNAIQLELAKLQQSQTQIAQYGLMQVVNQAASGQKSSLNNAVPGQQVQAVSGAGPHQIIVASAQTQAYQSRSQQLAHQQHAQLMVGGGNSNSQANGVVRKPVAAQIQPGQSNSAQKNAQMACRVGQQQSLLHPQKQLQQTQFSPLKLQHNQKVQINAYSQSQQMVPQPNQVNAAGTDRNLNNGVVGVGPTSGVIQAQINARKCELSSPIMLKTKAPNGPNQLESGLKQSLVPPQSRITKPLNPGQPQQQLPQQTRS